jgi:hypothetical protein
MPIYISRGRFTSDGSQAHAGWTLLRGKYDDGGFSGVNGLIEDWYGEELGYDYADLNVHPL